MAASFGKSTGIRVVISSNARTASTNGKTVTLPAVKIETPADEEVIDAYCYHEAVHIRYTDFSLMKAEIGANAILHEIWNIIEDAWGERVGEEYWPGLKLRFSNLDRRLNPFDPQRQPTVFSYLSDTSLFRVRGRAFMEQKYNQSREAIEAHYGEDFVDMLESMVMGTLKVDSTREAISLAKEIFGFLEEETKKNPPPPPQSQPGQPQEGQGDSSQGQSSGQGGSTDPSQNLGSQGGSSQDDSKPEDGKGSRGNKKQRNKPKQDDEGQEDSGSAGGQQPGQPENGSSSPPGSRKPLDMGELEQQAKDHKDFGERLKDLINDMEKDAGAHYPQFPDIVLGREVAIPQSEVDSAANQLAILRAAMIADKFNRPVSGYRGKRLDARKLPGLITGTDARVFTSPAPQRALDTYVHLVVDASYSMSEQGRMKQANLVFLGLLQVLQGMPGIKVETTAFTTVADKPVVFPHSGKSNMGFLAIENTPLGEALDWVFYRVLGAHEKRKVLFVITDGQPNVPAKAIQSMQPFKDAGFQTIGILISPQAPQIFDHSVTIQQAQQLPAALNSIWSTLLYPER
jgi:hypothetical protein